MVAVYKCGTGCVADAMKPDSGMSVYSQHPDLIPLKRKTEKWSEIWNLYRIPIGTSKNPIGKE